MFGNSAVGFTGTQLGMTRAQREAFTNQLNALWWEGFTEFHHGDCIGADEEAHYIAKSLGFRVVCHPPISTSKRAFCEGCDEEREPKGYLERDDDIAAETQILVATPKEKEEQLRSGTWTTVRYARKRGRPRVLVYPDGTVLHRA
jgi:hypothetical protein